MTYEDLVFTNPVFGEVRVLATDPAVAINEASFYRSHRLIEGHLYEAIGKLVYLDDHPEGYELGRAAFPSISGGRSHFSVEYTPTEELSLAVQELASLHTGLDAQSFGAFRPYFVGINGYPGASGLYSESIPILDLLIHGGVNMEPDEREQIQANIDTGLYPNQEGYSALLRSLLQDDTPQMYMPDSTRSELIKQLNAFRRIHRGSVKRFVPEALNGAAAGSGGVANVAGYLASKVISVQEGVLHD
jgi:hypothetical protein